MSLGLNGPIVPLIDYLDDKIKKWWEHPELVNALLTDRTYHLTHLELFRVGSLTLTSETANTEMVTYKTQETSLFNMYRNKYDIELKNPEMPLFMCDDGEPTKYPAEIIMLEIIKGTVPRKTLFAGEGHRTLSLAAYLNERIGQDWVHESELVQYHLKDVDFHMTLHDMPNFGSLTISEKLPTSIMSFKIGMMSFQQWFSKSHLYDIKDTTTPLITVNKSDSKKFHWPAELIQIVIY